MAGDVSDCMMTGRVEMLENHASQGHTTRPAPKVTQLWVLEFDRALSRCPVLLGKRGRREILGKKQNGDSMRVVCKEGEGGDLCRKDVFMCVCVCVCVVSCARERVGGKEGGKKGKGCESSHPSQTRGSPGGLRLRRSKWIIVKQ